MFVNRGPRPVFVIPHEKERENVEELVGDDASIVFITTPGQVTLSSFTYSCVEKLVYEKEKEKENVSKNAQNNRKLVLGYTRK